MLRFERRYFFLHRLPRPIELHDLRGVGCGWRVHVDVEERQDEVGVAVASKPREDGPSCHDVLVELEQRHRRVAPYRYRASALLPRSGRAFAFDSAGALHLEAALGEDSFEAFELSGR